MQLAIGNNNERAFLGSLADRAQQSVVQAVCFLDSGELGFYNLEIRRDQFLDLLPATQAHDAKSTARDRKAIGVRISHYEFQENCRRRQSLANLFQADCLTWLGLEHG